MLCRLLLALPFMHEGGKWYVLDNVVMKIVKMDRMRGLKFDLKRLTVSHFTIDGRV